MSATGAPVSMREFCSQQGCSSYCLCQSQRYEISSTSMTEEVSSSTARRRFFRSCDFFPLVSSSTCSDVVSSTNSTGTALAVDTGFPHSHNVDLADADTNVSSTVEDIELERDSGFSTEDNQPEELDLSTPVLSRITNTRPRRLSERSLSPPVLEHVHRRFHPRRLFAEEGRSLGLEHLNAGTDSSNVTYPTARHSFVTSTVEDTALSEDSDSDSDGESDEVHCFSARTFFTYEFWKEVKKSTDILRLNYEGFESAAARENPYHFSESAASRNHPYARARSHPVNVRSSWLAWEWEPVREPDDLTVSQYLQQRGVRVRCSAPSSTGPVLAKEEETVQ